MDIEICKLKHDAIDAHLKQHDELFDKNREEMEALKLNQNTTNTNLDNICKKLDKLVAAIYDFIKAAILGVCGAGITFIIWYIQSL